MNMLSANENENPSISDSEKTCVDFMLLRNMLNQLYDSGSITADESAVILKKLHNKLNCYFIVTSDN